MTETSNQKHSPASAEERRALDSDELAMTDMARQPALGALSDRDLSDLISRLRARRNRARDIANRQGREARAKAAPSGATPAGGNEGTLTKHDYLNAALDRATAERAARSTPDEPDAAGSEESASDQVKFAEKAQALKQEGATGPNEMMEEGAPLHPDDPDADTGKKGLSDTARRTAPSGAFDHAGDLPSRERSRTRY
ncbi:hypothetical protein [Pararhodobacter sp. SW119]|uniref:hypothetical protein n=1 Tax=Pararhodobacter sp. SW119 TaxID=2780075 RepID=UPI001ADF5348|nr:hypothetical protein [Pararhodobacter sp. SW119]